MKEKTISPTGNQKQSSSSQNRVHKTGTSFDRARVQLQVTLFQSNSYIRSVVDERNGSIGMNYPPISSNQSLPNDIRNARSEGSLTLFLGAGVSASMGCKTWAELAQTLVQKCHERGFINYAERDYHLQQVSDHRLAQTISFCKIKLEQSGAIQDYYDVVVASCRADPQKASTFCLELKRLADYFITTNYDDGFDRYFSENDIVFKTDDFEKMGILGTKISPGKLYHIHGSIIEPSSIVLTESDYGKKYSPNFQKFLIDIFAAHSLLFIGYSLEEEIIKYLIQHAKNLNNNRKHFVLKHYYSHETLSYKMEKELFESSGIEVISYIGDTMHYQEMINIIRSWSKQMEETEVAVQ